MFPKLLQVSPHLFNRNRLGNIQFHTLRQEGECCSGPGGAEVQTHSLRAFLSQALAEALDTLQIPYVTGVFENRAITGKSADAGDIQNRHARPPAGILERFGRFLMSIQVCRQVRQVKVLVVRVQYRLKHPRE